MAFPDVSSSDDSDSSEDSYLEDGGYERICPATNLNRELLNAGHDGNLMRAQRLLEAGADINYNEYDAFNLYTPVCLAIQFNHVDMLSWLQPDVDIQKPCCVGTPLVLACQEASVEIINMLLENGARDSTAIIKAKNMQIIDRLLQHGADINTTDSEGSTLLHSACNSYRDQVGMVTKLLELGANANARNKNGETPLGCAASHSHVNIATLLLERGGADVDASDYHRGNTPLLRSHQTPMLALLLERGANVNARDNEGSTKLHDICCMMKSSPGAAFANVTLLVQAGIDLNAKNNNGETALFTAIRQDKRDLVNRLLQEGTDPNAVDNKGWTALHAASNRGRTHLVDPLFEAGVNMNAASDNGTTALHLAVWSVWDYEGKTVKKLLEHGADANARTQHGSTPLGTYGHLEVRRWLRCCWNTVPM
jgi:ankyrin repeat protein